MEILNAELADLDNKQMGGYKLTKYFLIYVISEILRNNDVSAKFLSVKEVLRSYKNRENLLEEVEELMGDIIVDLNYEVDSEGEDFDYKREFKSPERVRAWKDRLMRSYEKDLKRGKTVDFSELTIE